jgi:hypothetical protein
MKRKLFLGYSPQTLVCSGAGVKASTAPNSCPQNELTVGALGPPAQLFVAPKLIKARVSQGMSSKESIKKFSLSHVWPTVLNFTYVSLL